MPSSELIKILRTGAQGLDYSVRFLILDACDRLERQIRDNELLMNKIVELRSSKDKTNADRIRAMSDEEFSCFLTLVENGKTGKTTFDDTSDYWLKWLKQPVEDDNG